MGQFGTGYLFHPFRLFHCSNIPLAEQVERVEQKQSLVPMFHVSGIEQLEHGGTPANCL
jgi:hypothetical protein